MAEKGPPQVRFIKVKPAEDDGDTHPPLINDSVMKDENKIDRKPGFLTFAQHDEILPDVTEDVGINKRVTKHPNVEDEGTEVTKRKKRVKKNAVLPLDVTKSDYLDEEQNEELNIGEPDSRNGKKKKTSKKKDKSKKKKKKKEKREPEKVVLPIEETREPEIVAAPLEHDENADDKKKTRKLPCCFGFISTWLAKRKQKRRDKKKKAIADRSSPPKLAQYEHRKAKGGEAFVIEVDARPIVKKAVLPPIKQTAGPIRRGIDCRLQTAEAKREEELARRREAARTHERKMIECKERKADADYHFRKKAHLTIRYRQADAERNRNNLSRCRTSMRPTSTIQSSSSESVIIESCPDAFSVDNNDPDAWKVDDVDIFSY